MARLLALGYGIVCYVMFLGTFVYAVGFMGNFLVPKSIDSGAAGAFWPSVLVNLGLLGLFGLQHSVMARPAFKRWWTRLVPESVERSTFVLFANLVLILLFWQWRPLPSVVWSVEAGAARAVLWGLFACGWVLVVISTFLISHAHLFGLQQVGLLNDDGGEPEFQAPGLYRYVRHPMMVGFFLAFWATPELTVGHLVFSVTACGYILVALQLEERDLVARFGERYQRYRQRVPMLVPGVSRKREATES
jgi:protein-S-isoprenylcysteine O-methyltransferase Ste14